MILHGILYSIESSEKKDAMNSHITKSNRVLIDAFCDMCFFMNVILFNLINGGHLHDTRYSKMV